MIVRQSRIEDLDAILAIKRDPHIAKHQYKFRATEYASFVSRVLTGEDTFKGITTRFSTIEDAGVVNGYVRHDHYAVFGTKMVQCSFNVAPPFWGQGKMKHSLNHLIDEWIRIEGDQHIFADHFRTNARCDHLLTGLRFEHQSISIFERACAFVQYRCGHWIIRRRLDASKWSATKIEG